MKKALGLASLAALTGLAGWAAFQGGSDADPRAPHGGHVAKGNAPAPAREHPPLAQGPGRPAAPEASGSGAESPPYASVRSLDEIPGYAREAAAQAVFAMRAGPERGREATDGTVETERRDGSPSPAMDEVPPASADPVYVRVDDHDGKDGEMPAEIVAALGPQLGPIAQAQYKQIALQKPNDRNR